MMDPPTDIEESDEPEMRRSCSNCSHYYPVSDGEDGDWEECEASDGMDLTEHDWEMRNLFSQTDGREGRCDDFQLARPPDESPRQM